MEARHLYQINIKRNHKKSIYVHFMNRLREVMEVQRAGEFRFFKNIERAKNKFKMCLCSLRRSVLSAVFPHVSPVRRVGVREGSRVLFGLKIYAIVIDERVTFWPNCPLSPITRGSTAWLGFG